MPRESEGRSDDPLGNLTAGAREGTNTRPGHASASESMPEVKKSKTMMKLEKMAVDGNLHDLFTKLKSNNLRIAKKILERYGDEKLRELITNVIDALLEKLKKEENFKIEDRSIEVNQFLRLTRLPSLEAQDFLEIFKAQINDPQSKIIELLENFRFF